MTSQDEPRTHLKGKSAGRRVRGGRPQPKVTNVKADGVVFRRRELGNLALDDRYERRPWWDR